MQKNILYFDAGTGFGGSSRSLVDIVRLLNRKVFKVTVVTQGKGPNMDAIRDMGITVHTLPRKTVNDASVITKIPGLGFFVIQVPLMFKLMSIAKKEKSDLIHMNTSLSSGIAAFFCAKILRIKCICHVRGGGRIAPTTNRFVPLVDHFIFGSKALRDHHPTLRKPEAAKSDVIYEGIHFAESQNSTNSVNELKKTYRIPQGKFVIGTVSRIVEKKGLSEFVSMATHVVQSGTDAHFVIVGESPHGEGLAYEKTLKERIKSAGLEQRFTFAGWVEDVPAILRTFDLVVQPSKYPFEGFGRVNVEAMALKKPVVATDSGAFPEIVEHGSTGLIVPAGDSDALNEAVCQLIEHPALREEMGRKGKKRVREHFLTESAIKRIENVYYKLLGGLTASSNAVPTERTMRAVILADRNNRAAIAAIRSLTQRKVEAHLAMENSAARNSNYLGLTKYAPSKYPILRYDFSSPETLCESLVRFKKEIGPYTLIPSGEKAMRWILGSKTELEAHQINIPCVGLKTFEEVSSKESFMLLGAKFGLSIPEVLPKLTSRFNSKYVVKAKEFIPNKVRVLKFPFIVENEKTHQDLLQMNLNMKDHFIQEYVAGTSYYYCALYNDGNQALSFTQKTLAQEPNGASVVKAAPSTLPTEVTQKIDRMMKALKWHGTMMIELKAFEGKYYLIECNPRLWGPLQLALDNGVDFPYGLIELAEGREITQSVMPDKAVGYLWSFGYFRGWLMSKKLGRQFLKNTDTENANIKFRDLWARADTFFYFCIEYLDYLKYLFLKGTSKCFQSLSHTLVTQKERNKVSVEP